MYAKCLDVISNIAFCNSVHCFVRREDKATSIGNVSGEQVFVVALSNQSEFSFHSLAHSIVRFQYSRAELWLLWATKLLPLKQASFRWP